MALSFQSGKSNKLLFKIVYSSIVNIFINKSIHNNDNHKNEMDVFDTFIIQLTQKKINKWENIRIQRKINDRKSCVTLDVNNLVLNNTYSIKQINGLLEQYLEAQDKNSLEIIAKYCIENKICPSEDNLLKLLSFFAQNGSKNSIIHFQKIVEEINEELYQKNARFLHFMAEATWVKGKINESLELFDDVFDKYPNLRRKINFMLKHMIENVIYNRSEAILVTIINFAEKIALKYNNYFALTCVWQACFLSEWYADQCRAAEIFDQHEKLCVHIANKIYFVVNTALKNHQIEVVHRLFELLLKYKMKEHYSFVLQALFDYRYRQNDLRSCAEIVQWSLNVDISLPIFQQKQFLGLLLNNDPKTKLTQKTVENFKFKF